MTLDIATVTAKRQVTVSKAIQHGWKGCLPPWSRRSGRARSQASGLGQRSRRWSLRRPV